MMGKLYLAAAAATVLGATGAGAVTFVHTGAAQGYTAGPAGLYRVVATGAKGGASVPPLTSSLPTLAGGAGITMGATVALGAGSQLSIIVGGHGLGSTRSPINDNNFPYAAAGGGGGGTFVLGSGDAPVVVAGGGGGRGTAAGFPAIAAVSGQAGANGGPTGAIAGGSNGSGGASRPGPDVIFSYIYGAGGAGLLQRGQNASGVDLYGNFSFGGFGGESLAGSIYGASFGGGTGYKFGNNGGYGGGGGGGQSSGGGGGGYSGGGGAGNSSGSGGGGGSFTMAGATDVTSALSADLDGSVSIDALRYYAIAAPVVTTLDFGVVRAGSPAATQSVTVGNLIIVDPLSDTLVTTVGTLPANVSASAPGALGAGQSDAINFTLQSGIVAGDVSIGFTSQGTVGADVALPGATIALSGTVTDLASATLSSTGSGLLTFAGGVYVLNLGNIGAGAGVQSTQVSIGNGVTASAFSETLGGSFTGLGIDGFGFAGGSFADLAGGNTQLLGTLTFDRTGLSTGLHTQVIDFSLFSRFTGLGDYGLPGTQITVLANVLAAPGGVPEPASWTMLIAGFGLVGASMRHRKAAVRAA